MLTPWPFDPLVPLQYSTLMIDPPWAFQLRSELGQEKSPQAKYACMQTAEIASLPVSQLARGDAWVWLWCTFPMLQDGFEVLRAWSVTYVTGGAWVKRGTSGKLAMGTGYVLRSCAEPFLIGRFGMPQTASRSVRNILEAPRRQHSRKPDCAYATAEELFGPGRRADLFSRQTRPGWENWGRESTLFDQVAA